MTIVECYSRMGADYEDVLRRLEKEDRVLRFLSRFPEEGSYTTLRAALVAGNAEEAFRAAHSLKGICLNLGLVSLYRSSNALTEELRSGKAIPEADPLFARVTQDYQTAIQIIQELLRT